MLIRELRIEGLVGKNAESNMVANSRDDESSCEEAEHCYEGTFAQTGDSAETVSTCTPVSQFRPETYKQSCQPVSDVWGAFGDVLLWSEWGEVVDCFVLEYIKEDSCCYEHASNDANFFGDVLWVRDGVPLCQKAMP